MTDATPPTHSASASMTLAPTLGDANYWHKLIDETVAADFLDVTPRKMQADRQKGGGCRFVRLSPRCVKYRRSDLREYAEARLRTSTSDPGPAEPADAA